MSNVTRSDELKYRRLKKKTRKSDVFGHALLDLIHGLPENVPISDLVPAMQFYVMSYLVLCGVTMEEAISLASEAYDMAKEGHQSIIMGRDKSKSKAKPKSKNK